MNCTGGKTVLGGGAELVPSGTTLEDILNDVVIGQSFPLDTNTWRAVAQENDSEDSNWQLRVWAICANVSP